nr:pre-mRNA splicing Prp18-interacting factor [Tanacetum cinerariifolium]
MSSFVLCVGCGTPLYGFSPCQWCTSEHCGVDLRDGFCPLCNSSNSCVHDPDPNSFDYPSDSYNPPHPTHETYSGDSCGNDSQFGYDCPTQFPLNYEPKPSYIHDYNSYPHDSSSFPQQCFDQPQTPQSPVIHPPPQETSIETLHDQENEIDSDAFENKQYKPEDTQELFRDLFNDVQNIRKEIAEYINTPGWDHPAFCSNGDDDDEDYTIA